MHQDFFADTSARKVSFPTCQVGLSDLSTILPAAYQGQPFPLLLAPPPPLPLTFVSPLAARSPPIPSLRDPKAIARSGEGLKRSPEVWGVWCIQLGGGGLFSSNASPSQTFPSLQILEVGEDAGVIGPATKRNHNEYDECDLLHILSKVCIQRIPLGYPPPPVLRPEGDPTPRGRDVSLKTECTHPPGGPASQESFSILGPFPPPSTSFIVR